MEAACYSERYVNVYQTRRRNMPEGNHIKILEAAFKKIILSWYIHTEVTKKPNSVALSPPAKYIDWAAATFREILVPTFARGVPSGQRGGTPTAVNLFSTPEPLIFLSSRSSFIFMRLCGPLSRPKRYQCHHHHHQQQQAVVLFTEALCYNPEGRGFDSPWGHRNSQLT
jgi:hypothetical protein